MKRRLSQAEKREDRLAKAATLETEAGKLLQKAADIYLSVRQDGSYSRIMAAKGALGATGIPPFAYDAHTDSD